MQTIVSASRRTDIAAFYSEWLINRVRAGYCEVPNPVNPKRVCRVSLKPDDVAAIVFWTRNPKPLMRYLDELDSRGLRYYFQYTVLNNPREIDPRVPGVAAALSTFKKLAERIGPGRVIWRYDPIFFTTVTQSSFHVDSYSSIADALRGFTHRSVTSIVDIYNKIKTRVEALSRQGIVPIECNEATLGRTMVEMVNAAKRNNLEITSCAEQIDLSRYGVKPGKCVDNDLILKVFNINVNHKKDPAQRIACGCVVSRDIGMYDSCLFNCAYCYATSSMAGALVRFKSHEQTGPSLIPYNAE